MKTGGDIAKAVAKALFLRPYTDRLTVLLSGASSSLTGEQRKTLHVRWKAMTPQQRSEWVKANAGSDDSDRRVPAPGGEEQG